MSQRQKIVKLLQHHNGKINIRELENLLDIKDDQQSVKKMFLKQKKQFKRKIQQARQRCRHTKYDFFLVPENTLSVLEHSPVQEQFDGIIQGIIEARDEPINFVDLKVNISCCPFQNWVAWENFCQDQDDKYDVMVSQNKTQLFQREGKRKYQIAFPSSGVVY